MKLSDLVRNEAGERLLDDDKIQKLYTDINLYNKLKQEDSSQFKRNN